MTRPTAVVALGGGHGLAATLQALRHVTHDVTAVVTVADDGGSSGRLREEFGILPPGDLRMALAALCRDDDWGRTWSEVLQHRFSGDGALGGHSLGNLLIAALWETHATVDGLDWVARLLGAEGRVLPMAAVPLEIEADVSAPDEASGVLVVRGQVKVASTRGRVLAVRLLPQAPPVHPETVAAVETADFVVLGPGSWFTSVIPHLLVPDLRAALVGTRARRIVVLNLRAQAGETDGFSPERHLQVLSAHAPDLAIDVVVADPRHVDQTALLEAQCRALGAELVLEKVAMDDGSDRHDPSLLAATFTALTEGGRIGSWR
ncbi:MAG TPA: uridine diphosphate-N-acetylglucosamine-binding protein YvcK [Candidatus Limnocylindria bacterium]|nr:uridine diphosphate-N-acetylglucosamine-binding protein YvcK [Candidatus Limnocylindria bacterium]